jgi:hypothetical protein
MIRTIVVCGPVGLATGAGATSRWRGCSRAGGSNAGGTPGSIAALAGAASLLALCGAAAGQVTQNTRVTFALDWSDVGGTPNQILELGESALLRVSVSFTNQNTVGSFSPPVGTFSSGTIRFFGSGFIDLNGAGGAAGSWDVDPAHGYGPDPSWDVAGPPGYGTPGAGGASLRDIQFGQFVTQGHNLANPVVGIWSGLWTPASYLPREVVFSIAEGSSSGGFAAAVIFRLASNLGGMIQCPAEFFGTAQISIIPAPPALAVIAGAVLGARRRRRCVVSHGAG